MMFIQLYMAQAFAAYIYIIIYIYEHRLGQHIYDMNMFYKFPGHGLCIDVHPFRLEDSLMLTTFLMSLLVRSFSRRPEGPGGFLPSCRQPAGSPAVYKNQTRIIEITVVQQDNHNNRSNTNNEHK